MRSRGGIVEFEKGQVREMRDAQTILGLIRERGRKGLPLERVYRLLFNRDLYLTAYGRIYRNAGAMTKGATEETVDEMSLQKIDAIIDAVRQERYRWTPVRRVYIEKKHSTKKRPLGIPSWSDKLLQEVIRLILETFYEPGFCPQSHGFRPDRGCHTALREIYQTWVGVVWFIEGDIAQCFTSLDHSILLATLSERIHDGRFLRLINNLLTAGYLEDWKFHQTYSGTPQGSICSPVLTNIYLHRLDRYVTETLIPVYTQGKRRRKNRAYFNLLAKAYRLRKEGKYAEAKQWRKQAQTLPAYDPNDPNYRRLRYCRYADDILLGFVGSRTEAEEIKRLLAVFLRDHLKLELSEEKTLITHARTEKARFLGYHIHTLQEDTQRDDRDQRSLNGKIGLRVPEDVIEEKCRSLMRGHKVKHRPELYQESDFTILNTYQSEYRGVVNYYRLAYNLTNVDKWKGVMQQSLVKTLAAKFQISVPQVYRKYRTTLLVNGGRYQGLQVVREREGKKPLVATWGGISLKWSIQATIHDQRQHIWNVRSELEQRLLAQVCEYCGSTEHIQVHHIRALKDLKKYEGREKPAWVHIMAARQRKTLVLCHTCHHDVHAGRPMTRPSSRSRK
jgi:group II intron reverse transcriptase/maturase